MSIVIDSVRTHAAAMPHRLAVGCAETGRQWTWAQLDADIDRVAGWLVGKLGPANGERVATLTRNHPNMLVLQLACTRAGAIFVPYNWRLASAEIAALMVDADPALFFHDAEFIVPETQAEQFLLADLDLLGVAGTGAPAAARRGWDEPTTLLYTSGTSGRPKGVMVSEENAYWGPANFINGSLVSYDSVFLCDMPMFHTAGLFAAARVPILAGGTVWISAGFDPAKTIARIADPALGVTHYFSVPQMATTLWQHPDFSPEKFHRLTMYVTGGAPNPKAQVERFARAGIRFSDGFGMSETCSNFAMPVLDVERLIDKAGSCGLPLLGVEARIVNDEGVDVVQGATGELWIKGPSVTKGYWNQPDLTAKAFHDGWFKTGDAAMQDADGFYYLVDRKKDMYISGGENVYPAEVEAVLAELPDVAEAAVIGVPDERWGEVGRAFVIARAGASLSEDQVIAHCAARLAKFKVPVRVVITDAIPRTASGKVQKHLLPRD
ncbi:MAG: AMP-binding protein [Sphingomonadales bacterium]|nr:AMP-binding protein [Sphingomonadales bacterium]